jgi:putative ABC transport system permease protein
MNLTFSFEPIVLFTTVGIALILTIGMGLAGTYRILGQKASPVLRSL